MGGLMPTTLMKINHRLSLYVVEYWNATHGKYPKGFILSPEDLLDLRMWAAPFALERTEDGWVFIGIPIEERVGVSKPRALSHLGAEEEITWPVENT